CRRIACRRIACRRIACRSLAGIRIAGCRDGRGKGARCCGACRFVTRARHAACAAIRQLTPYPLGTSTAAQFAVTQTACAHAPLASSSERR
ncbi:hypothetical protein, partial [Achromobacter sp.]|uniref:hypothetical protein n=1 Tax=Achromobacter sp. TaxID=134375 RepID=UPI0028A12616